MSPEFAYQLALTHRQAGRFAESEALLRQIVAAQPANANAWHQLAAILLTTGRPGEAAGYLARAIAASPDQPHFYSDQGVACALLGRNEEAVISYQRALSLEPRAAPTHRNLGDILFAMGRNEEAIASYRRALALAPNEAAAHNNLGNVFLQQGCLIEAGDCYERAAQLDPRLLVAHSNLGDVLTKLGRPEAGLVCAQRVLALDPNFPDGYLNMGVACWLMSRFPEAEACYRRAIALRADFVSAHVNLGLLLLLLGRHAEGWREYEWHWRSKMPADRHGESGATLWDGKPAPGKSILTYADQGVGDTIHFLRYLPLLAERSGAARIVVACQSAVLPLLEQWRSERFEFVAQEDGPEPLTAHDLQLPLLSLPLVLDHPEPLPMATPYLQADERRRAVLRARLNRSASLLVGLAWSGNPTQGDNRRRSVPPEALLPILRVPGVSFVNLQVTPRGPLPPALATSGVLDITADLSDFADTAALLAELDLIITVDTGTAHVAGALGRPTWVMLARVPYWLWGLDGENTPLYPNLRLFRQTRAADWEGVVERVAGALHSFKG